MKLDFFTDRQYREDKVLNWVGIGLLIFISAFIWMPKRDGIQALFAIGFLLPMLCVLPFRKPEFKNYGGWITYLAIIFASYSTLTSFWAPISKPDFFIIQWLVLSIWLIGIAWYGSQRDIDWLRLQDYLLWIGLLIALISLVLFYKNNGWSARLETDFAAKNPNEVGALFGILTLLAFCQWLKAGTFAKATQYGLLALFLFIPLVASQSRGALLALMMTGLMAVYYIRPSRSKSILLTAVAVVLVCLIAYGILFAELTADRFSGGLRHIIWHEVFTRSVNEHFWFGLGMEKFQKIIIPDVDVFDHAHNVWLDTFYHTGLIGLALGLLHVFYVLQKFQPSQAQLSLYLWLMFSLVAAMFDYRTFFWQIDFKWFLFWIPVGLISAIQLQEKRVAQDRVMNKKEVDLELLDGR
jgi:hypothetical protein